jgi:hypothetical protein
VSTGRTGRLLLAALAAALLAPAPAHGQLGLDFSAPKKEEEKKKPDDRKKDRAAPDQGEPMVLAPLELGKKGAAATAKGLARERLEAARKLLDEGATETGALALSEILRDGKLAEAHDDARYLLAKTLARLGLHHSALSRFDTILAKGAQGTRYFHTALEYVFTIGKKLKNEQPVVNRVAAHAASGFPPAYQDRFNFLLAKYEYERGRALAEAGQASDARAAFTEARRLAGLVSQAPTGAATATPASGARELGVDESRSAPGDDFARARFVEGLVRYSLGDQAKAVEAFKEVVRLTNPKKAADADPLLRESAFLQLARIHYENRQNRYAIFYYGKMPWGGENWLEGLWEASYAHYRIADYEKTLGNLLTLQSPYFRDEYFPESWVLKAIVYYENCRYPEARSVLEAFNERYEPLYDELVALASKPSAPSVFLEQAVSPRVRRLAFTDPSIKRLADAAAEIDAEVDHGIGDRSTAFRTSPLAASLKERLAREKIKLSTEAGLRARAKLEYERDQLRSMLAQALRISIEVSRQEREALEGSLAAGSQVEVVKNLRWTHAVSDEHLYWPYEGEFWRDELGTYSYTLTKGCKDRPPRTGGR